MMEKMRNRKKRKGFTLVELIVVIAILGIIMALAVPRFTNMQASSAVKADATTAAQIINAARIQETETGKKVTSLNQSESSDGVLSKTYMDVPKPQTNNGGAFDITGGGNEAYIVKFKPDLSNDTYNHEQTITEGEKWSGPATNSKEISN